MVTRTKSRRTSAPAPARVIERVQVGVRLEKRIVKVLKGLAEAHDITLADLLEGIVLHTFEGRSPFGPDTLGRIRQLRAVYGLDLGPEDAHRLRERGENEKNERPPE